MVWAPECSQWAEIRPRHARDRYETGTGLIEFLLSQYLSRTCLVRVSSRWLPQGLPNQPAGPARERAGAERPILVLGRRGAARLGEDLGTSPCWTCGRLRWAASEWARRGGAANRPGLGHSLRKTQVRWALSKGHSVLTPILVLTAHRILVLSATRQPQRNGLTKQRIFPS
jgi:hypothetical protein